MPSCAAYHAPRSCYAIASQTTFMFIKILPVFLPKLHKVLMCALKEAFTAAVKLLKSGGAI